MIIFPKQQTHPPSHQSARSTISSTPNLDHEQERQRIAFNKTLDRETPSVLPASSQASTMADNTAGPMSHLHANPTQSGDTDSNIPNMEVNQFQPLARVQHMDASVMDSGTTLQPTVVTSPATSTLESSGLDDEQLLAFQNNLLSSSPPYSGSEIPDAIPEANSSNMDLVTNNLPSKSKAGSSEITAPSQFTVFPKFPTELRLKVWKYALPGPRVVEIEWRTAPEGWFCPEESQSQRSNLLETNKESRDVFLKNYVPLFKLGRIDKRPYNPKDYEHEFSQYATTYFDPEIDTLYIGACSIAELCITSHSLTALGANSWMKRVRLLACEMAEWNDCVGGLDPELRADVANFFLLPNLDGIIIIVGDLTYYELAPTSQVWAERPRGAIQFVDPDTNSEDIDLVKLRTDFAMGSDEDLREKRLTLVVKGILRGGVKPRIGNL